jgi:hypothetical protein
MKNFVIASFLFLGAINAQALILPAELKVGKYDINCDTANQVYNAPSRPITFVTKINVTSNDGVTFLIKGNSSYNGMNSPIDLEAVRKERVVNSSTSILYIFKWAQSPLKSAQVLNITKKSDTELKGIISTIGSQNNNSVTVSHNTSSNYLETKFSETKSRIDIRSDFRQSIDVKFDEKREMNDIDFGTTLTRELTTCIIDYSL